MSVHSSLKGIVHQVALRDEGEETQGGGDTRGGDTVERLALIRGCRQGTAFPPNQHAHHAGAVQLCWVKAKCPEWEIAHHS